MLPALRPPPADIVLVGEEPAFFRDLYHRFLLLPFSAALLTIAAALTGINTLFALLYWWLGGIANAEPASFLDAFSFSMQTLATIGYGAMYPKSDAAKIISNVEALTGLIATALSTGLLFTKFSMTRPTIRFTSNIVITPFNGVPTLMFRVGNERGNLIIDAQARLTMTSLTKTAEGGIFYNTVDLPLARDRSITFTRSWTLMHPITPGSPLYGLDAAEREAREIELNASISGTDDISLQLIHGRQKWETAQIREGYRMVDLMRTLPDGRLEADARRFDQVEVAQEKLTAPRSTP